MAEIVGLHINKLENNPNNRHLDHMAALNSAWHTMLDPEQGQVGEVKGRNPGTKVLARPYVRDQDYHHRYLTGSPQEAGQWAAAVCLAQRGRNPQADAWIVLNEPPCDNTDQLARLAQADIAFMKALEAQGAKGGIGAFSTGNIQLPSIDGGAAVRAYEPAFRYAAQKGHYLVIHCYAAARPMMGGVTPSGMHHDPRYWGLRWRLEIFPYMRSKGIPIPKVIISEFGLDLGFAKKHFGYTGQYVGYRVAPPWGYGESEAGARQYVDELIPFVAELAKDSEVQGLCIYCAGDNGDDRWKSFMVDWVLPYLANKTFPSPTTTAPPQPQPTPSPPPPSETIETVMLRVGATVATVPVTPDFALYRAIIRDGLIPNGAEAYTTFGGKNYAVRHAEHPSNGGAYVYYTEVNVWTPVTRLTRRPPRVEPPLPQFTIDRQYINRATLGKNYNHRPAGAKVRGVVLHHTGGGFRSSLNTLTSPTSGVGVQYLIDVDGSIYQLTEDTEAAWHAGYSIMNGLENANNFTLGYEIVNKGDGKTPYPPIQQAALIWLLRYHADKYGFGREWVETHKRIRAAYLTKYPGAKDANGKPISHKPDPAGLNVDAILDSVFGARARGAA